MTSTGSFWSGAYSGWCSQLATSACASCSNQGPYHRHCGCALHSGLWKFEGPSSPKCQVKIANKKSRSGMFRSISVQNLGEKGWSASCSPCSSGEMQSPFTETSFETREELADEECKSEGDGGNNLTVQLMEELATLIQQVKVGATSFEGETCTEEDEGPSAVDPKQILAHHSGMGRMVRSESDLCACAGAKDFPASPPLKDDSPRLPSQVE